MARTSGFVRLSTDPRMLYSLDMRDTATAHRKQMKELITDTLKDVTSLMDFLSCIITIIYKIV